MFNFAKFKIEMILAAVLIAVVGYFMWNYHHKDAVIDKLKTEQVATKIENQVLTNTVEHQEGEKLVNEAVNLAVKKQADNIHVKTDKIQKKTDEKIKDIEHYYDEQPKTPENARAEEIATSTAIIGGMWETYCVAKPDAAECQTKPASDVKPPTEGGVLVLGDVQDLPDLSNVA
jgi:hypothetical protein